MNLFNLYGKQKLLLAFEYGLCISETARTMRVKLKPTQVDLAEEIIVKEFREKSAERLAIEMIPNILAVFETK